MHQGLRLSRNFATQTLFLLQEALLPNAQFQSILPKLYSVLEDPRDSQRKSHCPPIIELQGLEFEVFPFSLELVLV